MSIAFTYFDQRQLVPPTLLGQSAHGIPLPRRGKFCTLPVPVMRAAKAWIWVPLITSKSILGRKLGRTWDNGVYWYLFSILLCQSSRSSQ